MLSFADVWNNAKQEYLYKNSAINKVVASQWIDCVTAVALEGDTALFSCPSSFQRDMFMRYEEEILSALEHALGFRVEIKATCPEEAPVPLYQKTEAPKISEASSILDTYTFSSFVAGEGNRLAHAASLSVAEEPGKSYNPLYIYGNSGLGKTHLMCAIGNYIKHKDPNTNVVYVKGEDFTNELVEAIRNNNTVEFRNKYRLADVFLVDDVQFLGGKRSSEEEMFHTFNTLYNARKQIVLTSDRSPKEIPTLEDRLRTRFESGPIIEVTKPDYETRCAILKQKADECNIELPQEIIDCLSQALKDNIRQLEGAVKKIKAGHFLMGKPLDVNLANEVLKDISSTLEPINVRVEKIIVRAAEIFNVSPDDIKSKKRAAQITAARHAAMYSIRELTNLSLPTIGTFFGRDHTTVMYAVTRTKEEMKDDNNFCLSVNAIIKDCSQ